MGHHDCKCSQNDKHRHKSRCYKKHKKVCIDRSLITQLPNVIGNPINEKFGDSRRIPADPIIAAGPKSVITMVNNLLAIHRKDTMEEIFVDSTSNFWAELFSDQFSPFDVYTVYDEFSKRFFLIAIVPIQVSATDFITGTWIAVSKDSDPQNGDDFFKYLYIAPDIADFPKIAVDKEAVYITTTDFALSGFLGQTVVVFDKVPLVDGSSSPSEIEPDFRKTFPAVHEVSQSNYIFPLQPRPSEKNKCSYEKNVEKVLLIQPRVTGSVEEFSGDTLRVYQIKNVLTNNPEVVFADVKVPEYVNNGNLSPITQPPPVIVATNQPIIGLAQGDIVKVSGVTANNSIWAAQNVFSDDGLDRQVARWYEIDVSRFLTENTLKLVQAGNADPGGTTNQIYPSINVNKCGDMAINFTLVGEDQYPAVAYTGRAKNDPKGTVRLPLEVPIGGDMYYQQDFGSGENRWGDYSGLAIDPCDHKTFWLFNMYPIAVNPGVILKTIVTTDAPGVGPFDGDPARFSPGFTEVSGLGGLADPLNACSPLTNDLTGQIGVVLFTGSCGSGTIVPNVEAAGAIATIITIQNLGGNPNQTKPTVGISEADGAILIDALENSEDPINITITNIPLGPETFGSDWTTFIGAFKIDKSCHKSCKDLNAPQTNNILSVGANSAETKRVLSVSKSVKPAKMKTIKKVLIEVTTNKDGKKIKKFTIVGENVITLQKY